MPPAVSEGDLGALSVDLAGNLRVTGGASSQTINGSISLAGTSAVSVVGTSINSLVGTSAVSMVGMSAVSVIGTLPVTLSSTSLTGVSAVSVVGTSNVSLIGTVPVTLTSTTITGLSAVSVVGTSLVSLVGAGFSNVSVVGTSLVSLVGTGVSNVSIVGTLPVTLAGDTDSIGTVFAAGLAANGAAVSGNPVLVGGRAGTTLPTAVTDGQAVSASYDAFGRAVTAVAPQALWGQGQVTVAASTTTTTIIAAAGASIKWALSTLACTSTQTATTVRVDIIDGINNGGTLIHSFYYPAGISSQDGGTNTMTFTPPWVCSANTAIGAKCSASVTDVRVVATAFKVT